MYRRPIVTLAGNGDEVTLDGVGHGFTLKPGMTGTGTAPRELTFAGLPQGGSVMRHRRSVNREIMIPIDVFPGTRENSYADREDTRRRLERICADKVEIRLKTKDGNRSAYGWLKDGLEGDFAKTAVNHVRDMFALTFECDDTAFYGPWREQVRRVGKGQKPFLSNQWPTTVIRNEVLNPSFELSTANWFSVAGRSQLSRVEGAGVDGGAAGKHAADVGASAFTYIRTEKISVSPGQWVGVRAAFKSPSAAAPQFTRIRAIFYSATNTQVGTADVTDVVTLGPEYERVGGAVQAPAETAYVYLYAYLYRDAAGAAPVQGNAWLTDQWFATVAATEPGALDGSATYFDGSMPGFSWSGPAHASASQKFEGGQTFFPMVLSASTVSGVYELEVQGDAEAWPIWQISGPGTDARLENQDTGEALFLSGMITETVTVDTRPRSQDITSISMPDGQWWDRAGRIVAGRLVEQDLFPLRPGTNRIRITMVNANEESTMRFRYQETYLAGH